MWLHPLIIRKKPRMLFLYYLGISNMDDLYIFCHVSEGVWVHVHAGSDDASYHAFEVLYDTLSADAPKFAWSRQKGIVNPLHRGGFRVR